MYVRKKSLSQKKRGEKKKKEKKIEPSDNRKWGTL